MLTELFDTVNRERGSAGFTLIELLIVVVIIGILAAIAIPQFSSTKEKAYVASMKADLRNLATAQEAYFAENPTGYASGTGDLSDYNTSEGVTVTIQSSSQSGWSATAEHAGVSGSDDCGIHFGSASAPTGSISGTVGSTPNGAPYCQE